jgi:hypothetical protein
MRLRVLKFALVVAVIITVASCWPLHYSSRRVPRWRSLVVALVGCTNGQATIELKNQWGQPVLVEPYVAVQYTDYKGVS